MILRPEVVLHTTTGRTFRGVLWRQYTGRWVVLKAAALMLGEEAQDVAGDVWIDRGKVDFVQVVG